MPAHIAPQTVSQVWPHLAIEHKRKQESTHQRMKIATMYTPATMSVVRCVALGVSDSFASRAKTAKLWSWTGNPST